MEIISNIINELVQPEISLTAPFLKTKLLASKVKNQVLLQWINLELTGYAKTSDLPNYRVFGCRLVGDWINGNGIAGYWKSTNSELPAYGYGDEWEEIFSKFYFRQSISTLESFLTTKNDSGQLEEPFSADVAEIIANKIRKYGNPFFSITRASKRISLSVVNDILSTLRSNLLDFMIKIDEEFGFVTDLNSLAKQENISSQITHIMSQTIIHNQGDSNIVNTGDNNTNTINFQKGNYDEVERIFKENGIAKNDISQLKKVIDLEEPELNKKKFGPKVNAWIKKMLTKSLDGSWKIGIDVAGKLLADVIEHYYGH